MSPSLASLPLASPQLREVELPELHTPSIADTDAPLAKRLDLFSGVKANVTVCAGHASATVGELMSLKEGAILALDRDVDAPFDVVLNGRVLARGQLVAVGDSFGIRISEVCSSPAR